MVEKIGNTGIRPQDFYGHCPQCHRDCRDDTSKLFLGDGEHGGKFSLGFEVEDKFKNFEPNESEYEKYLTKEYPNGCVSGGEADKIVTPVTVKRCTTMGDIRIGYSDSYTYHGEWGNELFFGNERTYMKKSEKYYARLPNALGPDANDEDIHFWINCRHKNTDHVDEIKTGTGNLDTTIDDCVAGIWDGPEIWNVVDTFTTIEEIDVFAKMDFFSVYPICHGGAIQTSAENDTPVLILLKGLDVHDFEYKSAGCEDYDEDYGDCIEMKGKAFFVLVHHGGTGCRTNDSRRSLHPHMVGVNAGTGENYKPTDVNGPDPRPNRGRWFKQAMGGQVLGLYRQTLARRIGKIYKTTVTAPLHKMPFQQEVGGTYYTLLDPYEPGRKTVHGRNNFWDCEDTYGSPWLLQFPCLSEHRDENNELICDEYADDFCDSQKGHIYETFEEAAEALAKKQRRKLVRGGAPTIPRDSCSSLLTFSKCEEGRYCTDYRNSNWNDAGGAGRDEKSKQGRTGPLDLDWTGFLLNRKIDPSTGLPKASDGIKEEHQFIIKNNKEYEIDPDDEYNIKAKYYMHNRIKKCCGDGGGDALAFASFYAVETREWGFPRTKCAPMDQSHPPDGNGLDFRPVKIVQFKVEKTEIPDDYGIGGVHTSIEDSLKAWTCVRSNFEDYAPDYGNTREYTDYGAAGVFYRYTLDEYKYKIKKEFGVNDSHLWLGCRPFGEEMKPRQLPPFDDPNWDECRALFPHDENVNNIVVDGNCNLTDPPYNRCDRPQNVPMNIFTGAGDSPPRYDDDGFHRVKDDCTVQYDDISALTEGMIGARENILECYADTEDADLPEGLECPILDDEDEPVLDEDGKPTYKPGPCFNDNDWIYAVHREFYKFKIPETFYSCGETIGEGSDDEPDVCKAKWPCVECCGLIGHTLYGCTKCTAPNFYADTEEWGRGCLCRKEAHRDSEPANACCEEKVPNQFCIDNPGECVDDVGEWNARGCMQFGGDPRDDKDWCWITGMLPGEKHSPFHHGYLWYTYYGLTPERHRANDYNFSYHCGQGMMEPCASPIINCCVPRYPDTDDPEDFVPCKLIAIPRITKKKPIGIELGEIPVKITLRSPDC